MDIFLANLVGKGSYLNSEGEVVTQLVSKVPTSGLVRTSGAKISPPRDRLNFTEEQKRLEVPIPLESMLEFAEFRFKVRDRLGATSEDAGQSPRTLIISFVE